MCTCTKLQSVVINDYVGHFESVAFLYIVLEGVAIYLNGHTVYFALLASGPWKFKRRMSIVRVLLS